MLMELIKLNMVLIVVTCLNTDHLERVAIIQICTIRFFFN